MLWTPSRLKLRCSCLVEKGLQRKEVEKCRATTTTTTTTYRYRVVILLSSRCIEVLGVELSQLLVGVLSYQLCVLNFR